MTPAPPRTLRRLRTGWRFRRDAPADAATPSFDDSDWEAVCVPHDWAIAGPFDRENDIQRTAILEDGETRTREHTGRTGGLPHAGNAWYRLPLDLPADLGDRHVRLELDGVMSHSQVYCNGQHVGGWPYGYASYAVDLTPAAVPGENCLAIQVANPPHSSRWYPGAGIYRPVRLLILDPVHVAHWGVRVTTPDVSPDEATMVVRVEVQSRGQDTEPIELETQVLAPGGSPVASALSSLVAEAEQGLFRHRLRLPSPVLWQADSPKLYTVRCLLRCQGRVCDCVDTRVGVRTLSFDARSGFALNGSPLQWKGVCLHHDLGPLGAAAETAAIRRQLTLLKDMGCNAIRTSHNPPAPQLLDLTDEMGFLVIVEAFDEWRAGKCENGYHRLFDEWAERDLRAMLRRDRNHPSVMMWSIGNEIREQGQADGADVAGFLHDICRDEDPTRPTTAGFNNAEAAIRNGLADVVDVPGWNYKPYLYGRFRLEHPDWPMYGSETASCISSRGEYYFPVDDEKSPVRDSLQVNSYDLSSPEWASCPDAEFRGIDETPGIMGEFVWTGFDYLGEPTPYGEHWPSRSSYFGIVDLCGLPKDRFHLYRSRWSRETTLHLLPHWTWPGREGRTTPVHCYTSCNAVELFVNGVSQGLRRKHIKNLMSRYRLVWSGVVYEPGELRAVAYGPKGDIVAETTVVTADAPAALDLSVDRACIAADGEDLAFVSVRVVDADTHPCPRAAPAVRIDVDGPARLVAMGNGDATSLETFSANPRRAFNGHCVAIVRSQKGRTGAVTVRARAEGIDAGHVTISTV